MSLYSKARRHIDMNRVKELREEKNEQKRIAKEVRDQIREELKNLNNPEFSNWRFDLEEGMTSSETFFTTLPAQGNVDLESIDAGTATPSRITDTAQVSSGAGTGKYDGFNLGKDYVFFNGADPSREYAPAISDLTTYDTVTISIIAGNDANGGTRPMYDSYLYWVVDGSIIVSSLADLVNSKTADSLTTYTFTIPKEARGKNSQLVIGSVDYQAGQYQERTLSDFIPITTDYNTAWYINELLQYSSWSPTTTMRTLADGVWTYAQRVYLNDPEWFIGKSFPRGYPTPVNGYESAIDDDEREYIFNSLLTQFGSGVNRWPATYGITKVAYQRRTPVTVFVGLDNPEAASFIRTDPVLSNLSPEQRAKRLKKMLEAGDEYLAKMFGENFPGTGAQLADIEPQQSFMDIQAGGERITKVGGKTVTDTTRGIEDGKMDGKPIYHDTQGNIRVGEKPQATTQSQRTVRQYSFDDKLKGTWADPEFRDKQVADARAAAYDPNAPFAKGGVGDTEWMDQQAEIARANAKGETAKQLSKPVPKIDTSNQAELERNIRTSLRQLEIDNKELEGDRFRRNLEFAADLGLDILTFITILSPIPGDEAAALSVQATKQGVKTATKTTVKNQVKRALADPNKSKKIQQAVDDGYMTLDDLLSSPLAPRPDKLPHSIPRGIKHNLRQSYNPQGEILTEKKKLKSPSDIMNKIPGYYDGKPSPLGFPIEPPPKTVNGYHPDLVDGKKVSQRFNKLDPTSAKAMPMTGNPHIDKKIKKARNKAK